MAEKLKILLKKYDNIKYKQFIVIILFLLLGVICFLVDSKEEQKNTFDQEESPTFADTYIPSGYVLVPIELANTDSLASILGNYGVVDLFSQLAQNKNSKPLAQKVKIIRAPLDPNQFAVLVPQDEAASIVQHNGPLVAVLQNRNQKGTEFYKKIKNRSRISVYYEEDTSDELQ